MTSYKTLLHKRCNQDGTPVYWKPQAIKRTPFTLFNDDSLQVKSEWGVEQAIKRTLALACCLEIPVGGYLGETSRKESSFFNDAPLIKKLVLTNITDETYHDQGVQDAAKVYEVAPSTLREAELIKNAWLEANGHPLQKACWTEVGVFLISLAILRLAGGSELSAMSEQISMDESRHVVTNRSLLRDLGLSPEGPSNEIQRLIDITLEWATQGLCIPGDELGMDCHFDAQFLQHSSSELIKLGIAPQLNELLDVQTHTLPFEVSNASIYSRVAIEESLYV